MTDHDMRHPSLRAQKFLKDREALENCARDLIAKYPNLIQVTMLYAWKGEDAPHMPGTTIIAEGKHVTPFELGVAGIQCTEFGGTCIDLLARKLADLSQEVHGTVDTDVPV